MIPNPDPAAGNTENTAPARPRFNVIDLARGIALVAMATFHLSWDLEFFGYLEAGTTRTAGFVIYARLIASSFLFLAGFSLVLAHRGGMKWRGYGKRLALVAGAAAAITIATRIATPDAFIFFGILHMIAFASVSGLLFLRAPVALTLAAGLFAIALPQFFRADVFNSLASWWIGLHTVPPRSNDFVPVFPFIGPFLIGMASSQWLTRSGRLAALGLYKGPGNAVSRALTFAGRHSLIVYLVHQPVLIALVWLATLVAPPVAPDPVQGMVNACVAQCRQTRDASFCTNYCTCVMDDVMTRGLFNDLNAGRLDAASEPLAGIVSGCTADAGMQE